jgi:hypothetical protein
MSNFTRTNLGGGLQRWQHKTKPVYIRHYPACVRRGQFYVFAVAGSRRIGQTRGEDGFLTLREAMACAEAA